MYIENIIIALRSIRANLLRSLLTIMIISIGIMSLVGILTAIDSIKSSINENFTSIGSNTFNIKSKSGSLNVGKRGKKPKKNQKITFREAKDFKEIFGINNQVSISSLLTGTATVKYKTKKTNPNIRIWGSDEFYLANSGYILSEGRNFSLDEINYGRFSIIIGNDLKNELFPYETAIGKRISVGNNKFNVIGVLASKGSSFGFSSDRATIIPIDIGRQFIESRMSYVISIMVNDVAALNNTISQSIATFRNIRGLTPLQEDDFRIVKSDNLVNILIDNIKYVTISATLIGFITLLGAAIGLMNIMLVSVTERTREIGTRIALGATPKLIRNQFLIESIVICQLGGIFGIILGVISGNVVALFTDGFFVIPWLWIISSIFLCFCVGISTGIFPAIQASKLNPIDALRYE